MTGVPTDYGPLVKELHERAEKMRQPLHAAFELTSACNLSCRMCYVRQSGSDRTARKRELSTAQWLELSRQAKDNGLLFLLLTGGEVFCRQDFFDIYEPLTRLGLIITVFTNGTLITPAIAARLAQAPPSRTEITLYGATAATYEAITGVPGSYAACCASIEALVAQGLTLELKTTLTRHNVAELEDMREMAHNWGLTFSGAWLLSKRPDGQLSNVDHCRLSAAECIELEANDQASANESSEVAIAGTPAQNENNFYCKAGKATYAINPYGDMNACQLISLPAARPLENGFQAAWAQVTKFVDSVQAPSPVCLSCEVGAYCGRCPAWSLNETGTLTEPVPYWCEIARARKERYERPA